MDNIYVCDLEANGIKATKVWCMSYAKFTPYTNPVIEVTTEYEVIKEFFNDPTKTVVGHNFPLYDIPTLERVLGFKVKCKIIDTLPISWYLYPSRTKHGLAEWGETFGIPKVKVGNDEWIGIGEEKEKILKYYEEKN